MALQAAAYRAARRNVIRHIGIANWRTLPRLTVPHVVERRVRIIVDGATRDVVKKLKHFQTVVGAPL